MQPEAIEESWDWLSRAERDLLIADRAINDEPVLAEQCAFHAQQASEKALKAFLTLGSMPFPKSHDLIRLVTMCQSIDETFGQFLSVAQLLNPYATQFRYPGGLLEPELVEAQEALQLATQLVDFVRERLPKQ